MKTVIDFIFLCSKITADGDWNHEIKRHLFLGRKAMTNLNSMLKSRDITLPTKLHLVKAIFFPVVMYGYESWTIKKAEHWRTDALELWCWRRLLRAPWTARISSQSILKEINPEYYWKNWCWNSNTLATWCEELTHWKRPWCWERLKAGGEGWGQRMRWLDSIIDSMDMNLSKLWEIMEDRGNWRAVTHRITKSWTWLSNNNNRPISEKCDFSSTLYIYIYIYI